MKKFISTIFALALWLGVFAQNDTLFIHRGGQIIYELPVANIDSITFVRVQRPSQPPIETDTGVVINGVRWATRNVDMPNTFAENPESLGMFYQWDRNIGWSSTDPMINSNGGTTWDSFAPTGSTWERANDPCPQGWRVPTREEIETLGNTANVSSQWTTVNGVNGRTFTDRNTGNSIFLPAVGWRNSPRGALLVAGDDGVYWSSTFIGTANAWGLGFVRGSVSAGTVILIRAGGSSVRCVAE